MTGLSCGILAGAISAQLQMQGDGLAGIT